MGLPSALIYLQYRKTNQHDHYHQSEVDGLEKDFFPYTNWKALFSIFKMFTLKIELAIFIEVSIRLWKCNKNHK